MRAKCLIGLGLLAMLAASCALDAPSAPEQGLYPSITAGFDNGATKVSVDEAGDVVWNEGDKIALFYHNVGALCYVLEEGAGSTSGTFGYSNGADGGSTIPYICGFYPYAREVKLSTDGEFSFQWPAVQAYAEDSFAPGSNPMVAVSQEPSLYFRNLGGWLVLPLWGESASVKSITLCGAAGEPLAGPAVAYASPYEAPEVWMDDDAVGEVVLTCKEPVTVGETEDEATRFWFVLPPTRFEEGFGIKITYADGEEKEFWANDQEEIYQIYRNEVFEMAPLCITQKEPDEIQYLFWEDFEDDFEEERMDSWTFVDDDGDSYGWEYYYGKAQVTHSGYGVLASASFINNYGALYPDNWAITPAFQLSSTENWLSFWVVGQDPSYPAEPFAAYLIVGEPSDDIDDYTELYVGTASADCQQIVVEIDPEFNGKVVHLMFRHFDVTDMFRLNLDDVAVTDQEPGPDLPGPDGPDDHNIIFQEDFEDGWVDESIDDWYVCDADGDGYAWFYDDSGDNSHSGSTCLMGASYISGEALSPDNWAATPAIELAASSNQLSFWLCSYSSYYDHYGVYITTGDQDDIDGYVKLYEADLESTEYYEVTVDIPSEYDGKTVYIAFRHFDCIDQWRFYLDDITVSTTASGPSPAPALNAARKILPALSAPAAPISKQDAKDCPGKPFPTRVPFI